MDLLKLRRNALSGATRRPAIDAFLEADARTGPAPQSTVQQQPGSLVENARQRALMALGASPKPSMGIPQARLVTPTTGASGLRSMLPQRGTPGSAALGAFGSTMSQLGGYQDRPMTFGQILGASLGKAREAYGTAEERQRQIAAEKAASVRQAEQDALTKRYREAQIKQMAREKGTDVKKPYSVPAVKDGVRGTVQKQYLGMGALGADQYGLVEIPNSFVPDPAKSPLVSMPGDDEALKYAYRRLEKTGESASKAQELVDSYDQIILTLEANPNIETGPVQDAILPFKQLFADFGLLSQDEVNEVMTLERLRANMSFIVPRMREEGSGSTSNFEMGVFRQAAPQLSKRRDTNLLLAASAKQAAEYKTIVQSEREAYVLEYKKLPTKKELTEIMDAKHGSIFKTPFGEDIRVKSEDEVNEEFNRMYTEGIIKPGDVVYLGEYGGFTYIDKPFLQEAGLIQ